MTENTPNSFQGKMIGLSQSVKESKQAFLQEKLTGASEQTTFNEFVRQTAEAMQALFAEASRAETRGQIGSLADKLVSQAHSAREGASKVNQQILNQIYELVVPHTSQGKKEAEIPTEQIQELAQQFWQQKTDKMLKSHRGAHFRGMYKKAAESIQGDPQLSQYLNQENKLTPMQQIKALQGKAQEGEISPELATKLQQKLSESIDQYCTEAHEKGHVIPDSYKAQMQEKTKIAIEQNTANEQAVEQVPAQETELDNAAKSKFAGFVLRMFIKDMDIPEAATAGLGDALDQVFIENTKNLTDNSASLPIKAEDYQIITEQLQPALNLLDKLHKSEDQYSGTTESKTYEQQLRMKEVIDGMFFNEHGQPAYSSKRALRNRKFILAIATLGHIYSLVADPANEGDLNRARIFITSMDRLETADDAKRTKYTEILNNEVGGANFRKIMTQALEKIKANINILHTYEHQDPSEEQEKAYNLLEKVSKQLEQASSVNAASENIPLFVRS